MAHLIQTANEDQKLQISEKYFLPEFPINFLFLLYYHTSYSNNLFSLFTLLPSKMTAATTKVVTEVTVKKIKLFFTMLLVFLERAGSTIDHLFKN